MSTEFQTFIEALKNRYPSTQPKVIHFPSGVVTLDVILCGDLYVIESFSDGSYGLSRMRDAVYGWEGVEHSFASLSDLERHLANVLNNC